MTLDVAMMPNITHGQTFLSSEYVSISCYNWISFLGLEMIQLYTQSQYQLLVRHPECSLRLPLSWRTHLCFHCWAFCLWLHVYIEQSQPAPRTLWLWHLENSQPTLPQLFCKKGPKPLADKSDWWASFSGNSQMLQRSQGLAHSAWNAPAPTVSWPKLACTESTRPHTLWCYL